MASAAPRSLFSSAAAAAVFIIVAPGCKSSRGKLEQLVPDGATGMMSIQAQPLMKSDVYTKTMALAESNDKAAAVLATLKDDCKLDITTIDSYVVGFDALSQGAMVAVRMPNLGSKDALTCAGSLLEKEAGKSPWTLGEEDGKPSLTFGDGEAVGWGIDNDTLVVSSKGWATMVKQRIDGDGKPAIDNHLKDAVALANRDAHIWVAAEMPPIAKPFLAETPGKGIERAAASMSLDGDLNIAMSVMFAEASQASDLKALIDSQVATFKPLAVGQGAPTAMFDNLEVSADGTTLTATTKFAFGPLMDESTKAFTKYMNRSKSSEARVQIGKMFDSASAYFNEEHVSRGAVALIGADGAIADVAPHGCPSMPGAAKGTSGIVPPLSVDCSKGPEGKCVPVSGETSEPGHYSISLWEDNAVFNGLNFQLDNPHYYHYAFTYENTTTGYGTCQFTTQAFGDLDGDGVFSTYERAGAGDQHGVNAAAGLYIDQETE